MKISLLLEIGVEEIPAGFLPGAIRDLQGLAERLFTDKGITFSRMQAFATPRRIALAIEGVDPLQQSRTREVFGPPKRAAFDKEGNPTKAAQGFARTQSVAVEDLVVKSKGKGEYVVAIVHEKGERVKDIAGRLFYFLIWALQFPKTMRWADGDERFARPIRWILALCDGEPVVFSPLAKGAILSGGTTFGHRFLHCGPLAVASAEQYKETLEKAFVIVDQEKRKAIIKQQMEERASTIGVLPVIDEELLETTAFLVEYPRVVACSFAQKFLALPRELLVSVMKGHLKCFAMEDESGSLSHHFLVVSNTKADNDSTIRKGAERVIRARLEDARFYYEEDIKSTLSMRVEGLKGVVFQEGLGTVFDRVERIVTLSEFFCGRLLRGGTGDPARALKKVLRAAHLCKADLITGVVREFPELQGIMGKYYALHDKEDPEVAEAVREHYLPAFALDRVPATLTGTVVSLADKIDSLVSFFSLGRIPTGSEDPYALRRHAAGVIAIMTQKELRVSLQELFCEACVLLGKDMAVMDDIALFMRQRLESLFAASGYANDVIQSAMEGFMDISPSFIVNRLTVLKELGKSGGYDLFLLALKRVFNIIPAGFAVEVSQEFLGTPQEIRLFKETDALEDDITCAVKEGDFHRACALLLPLIDPINDFFDNVLVMDGDEKKKTNKLALLKKVRDISLKVADFSKLQYF